MSRRRVATAADLPALVALDAEAFGSDAWSEASWASELAQVPTTRHVEVLTDDSGELLAYVVLLMIADVAELLRIAAALDTRRSGHARVLLNAALEAARDRGCAEVLLEVASDNPAAVALYHSAGFTLLHRRTGYYGAGRDAVVMRLSC